MHIQYVYYRVYIHINTSHTHTHLRVYRSKLQGWTISPGIYCIQYLLSTSAQRPNWHIQLEFVQAVKNPKRFACFKNKTPKNAAYHEMTNQYWKSLSINYFCRLNNELIVLQILNTTWQMATLNLLMIYYVTMFLIYHWIFSFLCLFYIRHCMSVLIIYYYWGCEVLWFKFCRGVIGCSYSPFSCVALKIAIWVNQMKSVYFPVL